MICLGRGGGVGGGGMWERQLKKLSVLELKLKLLHAQLEAHVLLQSVAVTGPVG